MKPTQKLTKLDPRAVIQSRWAEGDNLNCATVAFERLKRSIEHIGGNVSPIKVRPAASGNESFEIVFGHARLRACLELGLSVSVAIEQMTDFELVQQFVAHQSVKKWAPWRMSFVVARSIHHGLFPSLRRAAESLGLTVSECGLLLKLDRLPEPVKSRLSKVALTPASARRLVKQWEINPAGTGEIPKVLQVLNLQPAAFQSFNSPASTARSAA